MSWISVKDRLPDCGVDVLVFRGSKHSLIVAWRNGEPTWFIGSYTKICAGRVTHWQPLPEPPSDD